MDIQNSSHALDNLLLQVLGQQQAQQRTPASGGVITATVKKSSQQDLVTLSGNKPDTGNDNNKSQSGDSQASKNLSTLVSEQIQETENGFRRTQEFENAQGQSFTRVEEITTTSDRSKRTVIQQNDSGSTTGLENVIDRLEDGSFRLIQRYTDEAGDTKVNVIPDFNPQDPDILLGRRSSAPVNNDNPFQTLRGTQIDLSA